MSSSGGGKRQHEEGPGRKPKGGIRWDEQNLEENERIKKELNPRKIDEPKTPYLSPMDTDEEGDLGHAMRPLALDDPVTAAAAAAAVAAAADAERPSGCSSGRSSDDAGPSGNSSGRGRGRHVRIGGRGWSDSDDRTVSPSPRHPDGASPGRAARSPRFSDQYYDDLHEHGDDDDDEGEGGEADPQRQEKRRRFKEARKQHYNMREQLARARELLEESEGSEDLAAAERQLPNGEQREQQQEQPATGATEAARESNGLSGAYSEGGQDADVESEQEGAAAAAGVRQGAPAGLPGGLPGAGMSDM